MKRSVLALVAVLLALPSLAGESKRFDRSVPFTPSKAHSLGLKTGPLTMESVEIRRWPDPDDFAKGERDLNDKHTAWLEFRYTNRDLDRDWKCRYTVEVTGGGQTFAREDHTATLDKGKVGDTNRLSFKMRTHEYKLARTLKITMEIWRKD